MIEVSEFDQKFWSKSGGKKPLYPGVEGKETGECVATGENPPEDWERAV